MLARCPSLSLLGLLAHPVTVEAQLTRGLPGFDLVGLADRVARECVVRVKSALTASGFELPPRHLVVNVAPSDLRKSGAGLDLPIALAALGATGHLPSGVLDDTLLLGELSLGGELRPVPGALAMLEGARDRRYARAILPATQPDAGFVRAQRVEQGATLLEVVHALRTGSPLPRPSSPDAPPLASGLELADVSGQDAAKRALLIAAAGLHPLLLSGPPGSGKTMLARRLAGLLAPASEDEALSFAMIRSAAGLDPAPRAERPFRAPHHTASASALAGGGDPIRPGEVTLAHGGVLFLDELPEFRRDALECLRTIMEQGEVTLVRVHARVTMPASPLVVAAMNPCPCGFAGDPKRACICTPDRVARYAQRISGPILDRFDLHVDVPRLPSSALVAGPRGTTTAQAREQVLAARVLLRELPTPTARDLAATTEPKACALLERAVDRLGLSARVHAKMLRVARTLAALRNSTRTSVEDVAEALTYRGLERSSASAVRVST